MCLTQPEIDAEIHTVMLSMLGQCQPALAEKQALDTGVEKTALFAHLC